MQMVEHHAKQVSQKKLAASAILKWENAPRTEFAQRERWSCTTPPLRFAESLERWWVM
jgi:hypothetical protein